VWKLDKKISQNLEEKIKFNLLKDLNEKLKIDFWLKIIKKMSQKSYLLKDLSNTRIKNLKKFFIQYLLSILILL